MSTELIRFPATDILGIPIVIICYNNDKYVENTITQLLAINDELIDWIYILNNNSTDTTTISYLQKTKVKVINNDTNNGPWIQPDTNIDIYNMLPDKFILTDPDLHFNEKMPKNFIEILSKLSDKYNTEKIGFALSITNTDTMYDNIFCNNRTIFEHENHFWQKKIDNEENYELYNAAIDTTFCLVNKKYINNGKHIRIAGNFTALHIPWYKLNNVINIYDEYRIYNKSTYSTMSKLFIDSFNERYAIIPKNNDCIIINKDVDDPNYHFWTKIFSSWENDTFIVFDKILNKNKTFIDIGGWIGTTCIYSSRKSKNVYVVEADKESIISLKENCRLNSDNITIIDKAIYNKSEDIVIFGKNTHLNNSKLNDSTSQICNNDNIDIQNEGYYSVKTITIDDIMKQYDIKPIDISLIKVDIEGGEEFILEDLFRLKRNYNVSLYISFHHSWWKNKDLTRFEFLTNEHINNIIDNPFTSILF